MLWSAGRSLSLRRHEPPTDHGVPARRIAWAVAAVLVLLLALTYALGTTEALTINGKPFTDTFWLRTSDMLINTSLVLMAIAAIAAAVAATGLGRRIK